MFSIFRSKPPTPTFNQRVDLFWRWFQGVAPRFYKNIERGNGGSLAGETSGKVKELFPEFGWEFGLGRNGSGHSFTLTGEGVVHLQLLALQWLGRAPVIEGWTFYAAKQPAAIKGRAIEIAGLRFDPKDIWVTPAVDAENEKIDITVWHPAWERIEPAQRSTVTFLFLDAALGEHGTGWWIGLIEYGKDKLAGSFPLEELAEFVQRTAAEKSWKKHLPGDQWSLLESSATGGDSPRADIITQATCVPQLFTDAAAASRDYDPLRNTGADYVYASIDNEYFPAGKETSRRGEVEDAVAAALALFDGGRCVGGAYGSKRSYCDFLIFDGERSLNAIKEALRKEKVPPGTMIEFFTAQKRGQRIAV